jgi:hypothetical protein
VIELKYLNVGLSTINARVSFEVVKHVPLVRSTKPHVAYLSTINVDLLVVLVVLSGILLVARAAL